MLGNEAINDGYEEALPKAKLTEENLIKNDQYSQYADQAKKKSN